MAIKIDALMLKHLLSASLSLIVSFRPFECSLTPFLFFEQIKRKTNNHPHAQVVFRCRPSERVNLIMNANIGFAHV